MSDSTLHTTLSSLLQQPVGSVTQIGRGRNSQVFRVQCANGDSYAAKVYFGQRADGLSRLSVEFESLELLWSHGIRCIPKPLAVDVDGGVAVYEYIDGEEIDGQTVARGEVDELLAFLGILKDLARTTPNMRIPAAYEACFSAAAIVRNTNEKLDRLVALVDDSPARRALHAFLQREFLPVLRDHTTQAKASLGEARFSAELPMGLRTLSPADFGFHNTLRRGSTGLVFLDFEYFGWEEPVKMMSDFLLHPAVSLAQDVREYFATRFLECFGDDEQLPARLRAAYPLYGLRWCMILLNEFLPDHLERRMFAAAREDDISQLCMQQLGKSKKMLERVQREHAFFSCAK
jgi:Phosphotransferase enzyme family